MTVQIKPLKGFKNPINNEKNTLSLLVKSDCKLQEHISNAREKLLVSLTNIIENYDSNYDILFYHKIQVPNGRKSDYLRTKAYKTKLDSIKIDLNASIENLLRIANGEFLSHFVNITILLNDEELKLSKDEFTKLNWKIRSKLSKMNSEKHNFVDDNNVETIEKRDKKFDDVKCLFIDDDNNDVETIEKKKKKKDRKVDDVERFKKNYKKTKSLFIDDDVEKFKKDYEGTKPLFVDDDDDYLFVDYEDSFDKPRIRNFFTH